MKKITFGAVMVLGTLALAKQNPADFNLTAHIISVEFSPTPSGIYEQRIRSDALGSIG